MPLNQRGHDPGGSLVEVYDHSQPPVWIEILAIEPLATRSRIVFSVVWIRDDSQHELDLIGEVWATEREVQSRSHVEDDEASVGIDGVGVW
jgi:hypothetical protein